MVKNSADLCAQRHEQNSRSAGSPKVCLLLPDCGASDYSTALADWGERQEHALPKWGSRQEHALPKWGSWQEHALPDWGKRGEHALGDYPSQGEPALAAHPTIWEER